MGHSDFYRDGEKWPSITEVLGIIDKSFLRHWHGKEERLAILRAIDQADDTTLARIRNKRPCSSKYGCFCEARAIGDVSRGVGDRLHEAIEHFLQGEGYELAGREADMMQMFLKWKEEKDFRPFELERKTVSERHKFHGSFDAMGTFGDSKELVICDWKTSGGIDDTYALQLAAYAAAYEEETGIGVTNGLIVRMDKKADSKKQFEVKEFKNLPAYFDVFLDCLSVWNFVNKKDKWGKQAA
jgi:hypothetical protein